MPFVFRLLLLVAVSCCWGCATTTPFKTDVPMDGPHPWTAIPATAAGESANQEDLHFVVMPDRTGGERVGIHAQAIALANRQQPDFVISIGDMIGGYTTNTLGIAAQWTEQLMMEKAYRVPFFRLAGNHDITFPVMREEYIRRCGPLDYSFSYKGALFICLDAFSGQEVVDYQRPSYTQQQVDYVREVLESNRHPRWTFLLTHAPSWQKGEPPREFREIEELLKDRPYTVFSGHTHFYRHMKRLGRDYITVATAGGGSDLRGIEAGEFDHVMNVWLRPQGPVFENVLLSGERYDVDLKPLNK